MNRLKLLFVFVAFFVCSSLFSQVYIITLTDPVRIDWSSFFVDSVIDTRYKPDSIGFAQVSVFNITKKAVLAGGTAHDLQQYLQNKYPKKEGAVGITIKINRFYISEYRNLKGEFGKAEITLEFYQSNDLMTKIQECSSEILASTMQDITSTHEERIKWVIGDCLKKFSASDWQKYVVTNTINKDSIPAAKTNTTIQVSATHVDEIKIKGSAFFQDGLQISFKMALNIMEKKDAAAYSILKEAYTAYIIAQVFGFVGGGVIGYSVGTYIGGGTVSNATLLIGGAACLVAIGFERGAIQKAKNAVNLYNAHLK